MKKLILITIVALFAVATIDAQNPRYPSRWMKDWCLAKDTAILDAVDSISAHDTKINTNITAIALGVTTATTNQGLNRLMADVIPLFSFSVGNSLATDTTAFSTSAEYASYPLYLGGADTAYITHFICAMEAGVQAEGTDTLDVQMSWDVNLSDATPTVLNTAALPVTSVTTGTVDTSFDNAVIAPGSYVWFTIPAVVTGRKPIQLVCTASGYYTD